MLESNRREGSYTVPSEDLYPFQWNWDSAFIAVGLAKERPEKAEKELESLVEAQWDNGMIPQIIFWQEAGGYFPGPGEWQIERDGVKTSGITQPPVAVHAVTELYRETGEESVLEKFAGPMERYLEWWREERSIDDLVYVRHPWETGMDDSPAWEPVMEDIEPGSPDYEREDLQLEDAEDERPGDWDYDRYVYLLRQARENDWDENTLRELSPFRVADVLTNSIFVRACRELSYIHRQLGNTRKEREWRRKAEETAEAIRDRLWESELRNFVSYDFAAGRKLRENTVAGLASLYGGIPDADQEEKLLQNMEKNFMEHRYGCATYSGEEQDLDRYWRGPVWINTNWLVSEGLDYRGHETKAERIREQSIELIEENGFSEYFNPESAEPRGSDRFSWTAALYLYWLDESYTSSSMSTQ
ncbi:MAG: amylo-alpha-1,6-glucosidase [Candidatus Nanohaloarchaea archaeon]